MVGDAMVDYLTAVQWSPYLAGAGVGVMAVLSFLLANRPLGCSTAFAKTSGMVEKAVRGEAVKEHPYYRKFVPAVDGTWMVVPGVVIGAFVAATLSGSFTLSWVPPLWAATFGECVLFRLVFALIGGFLLGFGSRWAGGCTSGHGISGSIQLSVNSMLAAAFFFIGGIAVAMVIYGVG
ncbi:YeeE/YedE thiosulfate transporter family protein [Methanofollis sp. UBA420]|uniref:YeeE/YedE thiosulfate transporter family protein n=1 Tax=Methanofollis sp. UBA420 TaxID=1915514 RepID=UPI00316AE77E